MTAANYANEQKLVETLINSRDRIRAELAKAIVGQREVIDEILIALFAGGHCLITGAPGLAKTLLVKSIAQIFHLQFNRVQFTPDLMPADITGTEILSETDQGRKLVFVRGPIFANMILADEINRTPPKTQAALLEAMQEHQVTAAGVKYALPNPFFVLATQNPIEMEGTYPLPEAQLDRFMFNVVINYLPEDDEVSVVKQTTAAVPVKIEPIFAAEDVIAFHEIVRRVPIAEDVIRYAVKLASATRPREKGALDFIQNWVNWGAGTRASQYLVLGAKARALLAGRSHATFEDVRALANPVLRHRVLLNYRAEAEGITMEKLIADLLEKGELSPTQRVQGMLKYGLRWPNELQDQKAIITFFDRHLEKGYTLIRNMTLGASGITVPMILLGPAGIYVIHVTYLRGRYEARGHSWNEESGAGFKPASVNLIQQTARMASAVKAWIERQGTKIPVSIEPVLIGANPGLHVESVKPTAKVLMIDGIKSFVTGLQTSERVLSAEAVHELTERIVNPRPARKAAGISIAVATPAWQEEKTQPPPGQQVSRARVIFDASEEVKPFNPADFDFAMVDEEPSLEALSASSSDSDLVQSPAPQASKRKRILGMTPAQLVIIAALVIFLILLVAVFAYLVLSSFPLLP